MIDYLVSAHQPQAHLFDLKMVIKEAKPQQRVSLPNWIPGSYLIRDFARHIISIEAFVGEGDNLPKIALKKINSNTWECDNEQGALTFHYTVYAWDLSVRGAYLDEAQAFFNGSCLFLLAEGFAHSPCKVFLSPPNCPHAMHWQVMTTLQREDAALWGFGAYQAGNYEELIDHPVAMGHFTLQEFTAGGAKHYIAVHGKHDGDLARLTKEVSQICQSQIDLFGGKAPFDNYLFILFVRREGYGGLEHRQSSVLLSQRDALPLPGFASSKEYIGLLGLFSHEYFHAWNVKRIKPLSFTPYDLDNKCYTQQLWAFEGITSYYDDLMLLRSKVISLEQYLNLLSQALTRLLRTPGRKKQSLTDSSFDAWIKFYQPTENSLNTMVSYYVKGSLVALAVDLVLRAANPPSSLDKVMQILWKEYGETGEGVPEGRIEEIMISLGGEELSFLLRQALYTTDELPLENLLDRFGLQLKLRQATSPEDQGGKSTSEADPDLGSFGWLLNKTNDRVFVSQVVEGGAAQQAGVWAQDEIIAIDGLKVDPLSIDKIMKRLKAKQRVNVHFFRQGLLEERTVVLQTLPFDTAEIVIQEGQQDKIKAWLNL